MVGDVGFHPTCSRLALFSSGEREEDLSEGGMEILDGELLQVVVEGVGDEEVEDWPGQ